MEEDGDDNIDLIAVRFRTRGVHGFFNRQKERPMPLLSTKQLSVLLRLPEQTLRLDRCRIQPQVPFFKTPTGRVFYDSDVVKAWLHKQLTSGRAK